MPDSSGISGKQDGPADGPPVRCLLIALALQQHVENTDA
jgi:hypothetical protein